MTIAICSCSCHLAVPLRFRCAVMNPIDPNAEWLEADGLGGFASGTVSGIRTRRYHALLLTATTPPAGRMVLVNGFDAWVGNAEWNLCISSQRYGPDVIHPDGASRIESLRIRAVAALALQDRRSRDRAGAVSFRKANRPFLCRGDSSAP